MKLQMVRKLAHRCLIGGFLVFIGYMLAVVSFRQEVWVDFHSGTRKTTCTLFPFLMSKDQSNDAFWMLFGCHGDDAAEWGIVDRKYFVDFTNGVLLRKVWQSSEGGGLVQAENYLVLSLLGKGYNTEERQKMSKQFYASLRDHGEPGAWRFADELYMEMLHRQQPDGQGSGGHDESHGNIEKKQ